MILLDAIAGLLVMVCATIPVVLLAFLGLRAHRSRHRLRATILGLTLIHELVLVWFPGLHSALTGFAMEADIGVSPDQLLRVYAGESIFLLCFAAALHASKMGRTVSREATPHQLAIDDRVFVYTLLIGTAVAVFARLLSPTYTYGDLATHYAVRIKTGLWEIALDWGSTLVQWPGLIAAAVVIPNRKVPKFWRLLASAILGLQLIYAMIHGFRGGVVVVVSVIAIAGYYGYQKRFFLVAGLLTISLVPAFPWLHSTMRYASFAAPTGTSRWNMIPVLFAGLMDPEALADAGQSTSFLNSWAYRAEGPRNSVTLYALHDQGESALYKPMLGSVVLPVPRLLWPDKPSAGSTDSGNLGMAIYRVQQGKPGASSYDMGPILASAHAYWEGGWLWMIAAGVLTGWLWSRLFRWAEASRRRSVDIIVLTFTAALPVDGFFSALNPLFTYARLIWITLIPLSILYYLLRKIALHDGTWPWGRAPGRVRVLPFNPAAQSKSA